MRRLFPLAFFLLFCTAGCTGDGPQMGEVVGKVTYQGKVVPEGTVSFYPSSGGRPCVGQIRSDGTYELSSRVPGDGVPIGEYRVAIEARKLIGGSARPKSLREELSKEFAARSKTKARIEWLVPQKYSSVELSELTAIVERKQNLIDFDIE